MYLILLEESKPRNHEFGTGTGYVLGLFQVLEDAIIAVKEKYNDFFQQPCIYEVALNRLEDASDLNNPIIKLVWKPRTS